VVHCVQQFPSTAKRALPRITPASRAAGPGAHRSQRIGTLSNPCERRLPGLIRTRVTEGTFANLETLRKYFQRIPLGRGGEPDKVAQASVFLAASLATYITGATLFVDGGQMGFEVRHADRRRCRVQ